MPAEVKFWRRTLEDGYDDSCEPWLLVLVLLRRRGAAGAFLLEFLENLLV